MLDESTREAVLRLAAEKHGTRAIARLLRISRGAVREVLRTRTVAPPRLPRAHKAETWRDDILALYPSCKGNLVRVHEELLAQGAKLSYPALTAFCRSAGIGHEPKQPAGRYHFEPGEEMQHDTSPHDADFVSGTRRGQTASVALCHSRMLFFQHYPRFNRFACKLFLHEAALYLEGVCARCMIDNTHVVVLHGTGADMVPVPEMASFADRYGFTFAAHEVGDANRSARVERPFDYIENNFFAGRVFNDFADLNAQARAWCDRVNAKHRKDLHASPRELFAAERVHMKPLPAWVPDPYVLHQRIVDVEGYVSVHTNRYSVPVTYIGRRVEVRELGVHVEVYDGARRIARHDKLQDPAHRRVTAPEHRPPRGQGLGRRRVDEQTEKLLAKAPELGEYVRALVARSRGAVLPPLRRLHALWREYPREPLLAVLRTARHYGLYDLDRVEQELLLQLARGHFNLPIPPSPPDDEDDGGDDDPDGVPV